MILAMQAVAVSLSCCDVLLLAADAGLSAAVCIERAEASVDPVYVHDVTVWLPQPEYDFLAQLAAASSSFAVQLMGEPGPSCAWTHLAQ